jgi:hypothetical protein
MVECGEHGRRPAAYVCAHLVGGDGLGFNADEPTGDNPWPDAWCDDCDVIWERVGGWENVPEEDVQISLICDACYAKIRDRNLRD